MAKTISKKFRNENDDFMFLEDEDRFLQKGKKQERQRRPVKNWKRQWLNATNPEDQDEFYG